jgi:tRNA (guanine-N7-)-methyltransferase
LERVQPEALFVNQQPIELELGSGDGSFLAKYATLHPELNFIGVERLLGRLRKLDKKGLKAALSNLRLIRLEAAYLLEFMLPPQSMSAIHVYFPDPWPKRKHRKNRLINAQFTVLAARVLKPNCVVWLRTDDLDYFQQMTQVFGDNEFFEKVETPEELSIVITDFERGFQARGVSTQRAAYRLKHQ